MPEDHGRTGHVAWYRHGDEPGLLVLHGVTDSAACWDPVIGELRRRVAVVSLDARGHGRSGLPDEPVGPATLAGDAALVLDDLELRRVVVLGHSMGAVTGAALALCRPDLVSALILEDPPSHGWPSGPHGVPPSLRELRELDLAERVARGRAGNPDWPADELVPWAESKAQFDPRFYELPREPMAPLGTVLPRIECPMLLLHGAADKGALTTAADAAELAEVAGGRLVTRGFDTGHSVRRQARDEYLAAVTDFLDSVL